MKPAKLSILSKPFVVVKPSRQLNITSLFTHYPSVGWGKESEKNLNLCSLNGTEKEGKIII